MADKLVARARELVAGATPGVWVQRGRSVDLPARNGDGYNGIHHCYTAADAFLIAAAPELVTQLCDDYEQMQERAERAERLVLTWATNNDDTMEAIEEYRERYGGDDD